MDEKKTYSIIGSVTIGTDEYRDLIERVTTAEKERDDYRSEGWTKGSKISSLEESLRKAEALNAEMTRFISRTNESAEAFDLWRLAEKRKKECGDEDV